MADSADSTKKNDSVEPAKAAREAVKAAEPSPEAESFAVERLISDGHDLLGHPPHVVAGALHGVNRKNLTVDEAQAAIKKWLKAPLAPEED